jgi:hypothetical protein
MINLLTRINSWNTSLNNNNNNNYKVVNESKEEEDLCREINMIA